MPGCVEGCGSFGSSHSDRVCVRTPDSADALADRARDEGQDVVQPVFRKKKRRKKREKKSVIDPARAFTLPESPLSSYRSKYSNAAHARPHGLDSLPSPPRLRAGRHIWAHGKPSGAKLPQHYAAVSLVPTLPCSNTLPPHRGQRPMTAGLRRVSAQPTYQSPRA